MNVLSLESLWCATWRPRRCGSDQMSMQLSDEILSRKITGRNLKTSTLGEELGDETRVLVFLRHFG